VVTPARRRVAAHPPAQVRLVGTCCLLLLLAAVGSGALQANQLRGEPPGHFAQLSEAPASAPGAEPLSFSTAPSPSVPTSAPTLVPTVAPTAAPPARPSAPPVAALAADLQAVPPPPNLAFPTWAISARDTDLYSEPAEGTLYNRVPEGSIFRVFDSKESRLRVFYPGDRASRKPGEAWVERSDLTPMAWPRWIRLREPSSVLATPSVSGSPIVSLRAGAYLEVIGEQRGDWARVSYLGEGRAPVVEGWLNVGPAGPIPGPEVASSFSLSQNLLQTAAPEVWIKVPYRSQIDGSPYADANCGPTVVNMVLESFGIQLSQPQVRREVLSFQPLEDCDDCGTYIQNLAEVFTRRGLRVHNLRDGDPEAFHRWTLDEVRSELRAGRPVIAQVYYRRLPARANASYWGDHYIVLTGLQADRFIFNDPIDTEGSGYSRLISASALEQAMGESDFPYAAFSVGR
jgi:hypothetical protein